MRNDGAMMMAHIQRCKLQAVCRDRGALMDYVLLVHTHTHTHTRIDQSAFAARLARFLAI